MGNEPRTTLPVEPGIKMDRAWIMQQGATKIAQEKILSDRKLIP
jgi:hypothetical protein